MSNEAAIGSSEAGTASELQPIPGRSLVVTSGILLAVYVLLSPVWWFLGIFMIWIPVLNYVWLLGPWLLPILPAVALFRVRRSKLRGLVVAGWLVLIGTLAIPIVWMNLMNHYATTLAP